MFSRDCTIHLPQQVRGESFCSEGVGPTDLVHPSTHSGLPSDLHSSRCFPDLLLQPYCTSHTVLYASNCTVRILPYFTYHTTLYFT